MNVTINGEAAITQTAPITAGTLLLTGTTADYTLTNADNAVTGSLRAIQFPLGEATGTKCAGEPVREGKRGGKERRNETGTPPGTRTRNLMIKSHLL